MQYYSNIQTLDKQAMLANGIAEPESRLQWKFTRSAKEIIAAQELRFKVFSEHMRTSLQTPEHSYELTDIDHFDRYCEHLIVIDESRNLVVGTYRMLDSAGAKRAGGWYSEQQFNLHFMGATHHDVVELGRSCVHPNYRDGSVMRLLWKGVTSYLNSKHERLVMGCPSVPAYDGGALGAAVYKTLMQKQSDRASPIVGVAKNPVAEEWLSLSLDPVIPPLLKFYAKNGALIASNPHHDTDFGSVDLLMVMQT